MSAPSLLAQAIFPLIKKAPPPAVAASSPVFQPWLPGLAIFYAVKDNEQLRLITVGELPDGLSPKQLHRLAVTNLDQKAIFEMEETPEGVYYIQAEGFQEASALCLNRLWVWLTSHFQDDILVAVPDEHCVLLAPVSDKHRVTALLNALATRQSPDEVQITHQLFRYGGDGYWDMWGEGDAGL